jgi:NAD(P)-dependent dehydrogenase (short-subunit alcohol dehydrogenase family)
MMASILITGAGRGFGRELFRIYRRRGWTVLPLGRDPEAAAELAGEGDCRPILVDITSPEVESTVAAVLGRHTSALDVLINNAGNIKKLRGLAATDPADMEALFRVHCVGALRVTRACLPFLGRSARATVVNISSRWGSIDRTVAGHGCGIYSYQMAKCAQNMLTACLDLELQPYGIRVFAVHPGRLKTTVAAPDADTDPTVAATRLADWIDSVDRAAVCGCHDVMEGRIIPW